jgi:hypothetical protein
MTRTFIAAVLAFLVLAPAANARLLVQPERTTDTGGKPLVQPERITDHRAEAPTSSLAGTTDETTAALAHEQYYKSQGHAVAALVKEQESTSGAGNQGVPSPDSDDTPWAIIAIGIAGGALVAAGVVVAVRRTRPRARVAA